MKKRFNLWLVLLALALSCAAAETAADPDFPVFEWERNVREHWRVLENGEKTDVGAHELDDVLCTVCGSEVWAFDDGWADVSNYNEYEELVRSTSYDENGEIVYDCVFSYGYDEHGVKQWEKQYDQGRLVGQTVYQINAEGENVPVWSESYYDDNTSARNEYDEHGNSVKAWTYDVDGTVTYESVSEYALGDDGWYYEAKSTAQMDGTVFINEYNQYGDWIYVSIIEPDGTVVSDTRFEYVYENGVKVSCKCYDAGILTRESYYDEWGRLYKEIEYLEDGSAEVYEFDEEGNLIKP